MFKILKSPVVKTTLILACIYIIVGWTLHFYAKAGLTSDACVVGDTTCHLPPDWAHIFNLWIFFYPILIIMIIIAMLMWKNIKAKK
jgi:hypothetical protein